MRWRMRRWLWLTPTRFWAQTKAIPSSLVFLPLFPLLFVFFFFFSLRLYPVLQELQSQYDDLKIKFDAQANALAAAKSLLSKTKSRVRELEEMVQTIPSSSSPSSSSHLSVAPSMAPRLKRARSPETPGLRMTSARSSFPQAHQGE